MALTPASLPRAGLLALALLADAVVVLLARQPLTAVALALLVPGVLLLATQRPRAAICAAAFGVVVSADLVDLVARMPAMSVGGLEVGLTDLYLATMLLGWSVWELRRPRPATHLSALVREPAFAVFVPLMLLAAYDLARGGYGTLSSCRIFGYAIAVPLVLRVVATRRDLQIAGTVVVAGAVVTAATAAAMLALGRNVTPSGLSTGGTRALSIGGSFLVAAGLLAVLAAAAARNRARPHVAEAVILLALLAGVAASGSRETWLGLVAAGTAFAATVGVHGVARLALTLGLAAGLAVSVYVVVPRPPQLADQVAAIEHRLTSITPGTQDPSVTVRYDKWSVVWSQVETHPVLGTGFGYPATYTSNIGGDNFVRAYVDDPENTHLWLWARMGTVGFAAWVAFNLLVLASALRIARRARDAVARAGALWSAGVLLLVWSGMTFSPISAFSSTLLLYWAAVALVPVARVLERHARHQENIVVERRNSSW